MPIIAQFACVLFCFLLYIFYLFFWYLCAFFTITVGEKRLLTQNSVYLLIIACLVDHCSELLVARFMMVVIIIHIVAQKIADINYTKRQN